MVRGHLHFWSSLSYKERTIRQVDTRVSPQHGHQQPRYQLAALAQLTRGWIFVLCACIFFFGREVGMRFWRFQSQIMDPKYYVSFGVFNNQINEIAAKANIGTWCNVLIFGGGDPSRPSRNNKPLKLKSEKKQPVYRPWGCLGFISTVNKPQAARMPTYKYQLSLEIIHNIEFRSQEMTDGNKCFYFSERLTIGQYKFFSHPPKSNPSSPKSPKKWTLKKNTLDKSFGWQ